LTPALIPPTPISPLFPYTTLFRSNISVKLSDAAGNTTTSAALAVTIDTTVATLNAPDLTTATDTAGPGGSTGDNLTKDNTPDFRIEEHKAAAQQPAKLLNHRSS